MGPMRWCDAMTDRPRASDVPLDLRVSVDERRVVTPLDANPAGQCVATRAGVCSREPSPEMWTPRSRGCSRQLHSPRFLLGHQLQDTRAEQGATVMNPLPPVPTTKIL